MLNHMIENLNKIHHSTGTSKSGVALRILGVVPKVGEKSVAVRGGDKGAA